MMPVLTRLSLLLLLLASTPLALAQIALPETTPAPATTAEPQVEPLPANPRDAMLRFVEAMNQVKTGKSEKINAALSALDLSAINPIVRQERGSSLAWMLLEVMERSPEITPDSIPETSEGQPYLFKNYPEGAIRISRDPQGRWLFDQETLEQIPAILDALEEPPEQLAQQDRSYLPWHMRFRQSLPEHLKEAPFILENWQWIGILVTILVGMLADKLITLMLRSLVRRWRSRRNNEDFSEVSSDILRPTGLMALAFIWWSGIHLLGLPEGAMLILLVAVKFVAGVSGVWTTYRLVDLIAVYLYRHAERTENKLDDALVPLIPKSLKIFITVVGFVFVADNLNIDISSLLAGLGLGGLAFALAAKDMVQNLFGSITVLLDRTFSVGDWIVVDGVEGAVECIGFRSTRVRTFYNSVITVPNSKFITAQVDNMGERTWRRYRTQLSLPYSTPPERLDAFCEGVRELVRLHPYMRKDYYHVYLNDFSDSALQVLVYVFWQTPDWATELRERHRFLLDILRLAQRLEVEFAFPSRTLYMQDPTPATTAAGLSQEEAVNLGREQAKQILKETLGPGNIPPPVRF